MITYNGAKLFSSGPATTDPGPVVSRDAISDLPGSIGVTLISQGRAPREIKQQGVLIGDDEPALRKLIEAIEQHVGSSASTLIDEHGKSWANCVMRRFQPQTIHRIGPRSAVAYLITYLQATP